MKELITGTLVIIITIVVVFIIYALTTNGRLWREQFTIQSITKVENDQCVGHSPDEYLEIPKHLKEQCNNVKFDIEDNHNIFFFF